MYLLFVLASMLAVVAGVGSLSQATLGVGVICGGIYLAILSRLIQAHSYHAEQMQILREMKRAIDPPASP